MVSVLTSGAVGHVFEPRSAQAKYYEIGISCMQHQGVRAKTGCLGIRIVCPSGAPCLPADCCFSDLTL